MEVWKTEVVGINRIVCQALKLKRVVEVVKLDRELSSSDLVL